MDKGTSGADDLDQPLNRDVVVEGRGVQGPLELAVKAELVPGVADD